MNRKRLLGSILLVFAVLGINTYALYQVFTSRGNYVIWDFHPTLVAAQSVLKGIDPYSAEVTQAIQELDYGRRAKPGEDVQAFAYPLAVAYLQIPLALLPLPWAQAAWLSILEAASLAGLILIAQVWRWPRNSLIQFLLSAWGIVFYPLVWSFVLGQLSILVFALLMLMVWAVGERRDGLGGIALGMTVLKPQISFVALPLVSLWAAYRRRWRFLVAVAISGLLLIGVPTLLQPSWVTSFFVRLREYNQYSPFTAPAILVMEWCCRDAAIILVPVLSFSFLAVVGYGWWKAATSNSHLDWLWAFGMTLIATTAIAPRTHILNQVVLLFPIYGVVALLQKRGGWWALSAILLLTALGGTLWLLSVVPPVSTAQPRYPMEHRVLSPILPMTLGLIWIAARPLLDRFDGSKSEMEVLPELLGDENE